MEKLQSYSVHGKELPVPSYFTIYNIGGGGGDRTRAVVYMDLYRNIPQLHNYYYLTLKAKTTFDVKTLKNLSSYNDFSDFLKYMRGELIKEKKYSNKHKFLPVKYNKIIFLLDSGAKNILYDIAKEKLGKKGNKSVVDAFINSMDDYYDFANQHKFDFVISFDTGGKYTFKDNEKKNQKLVEFDRYVSNNKISINIKILEKTLIYLKQHADFYPCVFATIHGNTPEEYKKYTRTVLGLEKKYNYKFWGFALGGVASAKGADSSWLKGYKKESGESKNSFISSLAAKIVHKIVGNRPIHALGAGGYQNIDSLYKNGVTSFDSNTPNRRVGDGSAKIAHKIMHSSKLKSAPQYLIGKTNSQMKNINSKLEQQYKPINEILDTIKLCGCPACEEVRCFNDIKKLYAKGSTKIEDFYLSRQLICAHSCWQHVFMCMRYWIDWEE